jgi:hypothetical protein
MWLGEQLPVGSHLERVARYLGEFEWPVRAHCVGELAEPVSERLGVGVGVDEHQPVPCIHRSAVQAQTRHVEFGELITLRRPFERAIEPVRPRIVEATNLAAGVAAAFEETCPAMSAEIVERPQRGVLGADDDELRAADVTRLEVAVANEVVEHPDELPGVVEQFALLALEPRLVRVRLRGKVVSVGKRRCDGFLLDQRVYDCILDERLSSNQCEARTRYVPSGAAMSATAIGTQQPIATMSRTSHAMATIPTQTNAPTTATAASTGASRTDRRRRLSAAFAA